MQLERFVKMTIMRGRFFPFPSFDDVAHLQITLSLTYIPLF